LDGDRFTIVGGGAAGSFLAFLLTDSGYNVTVYESLPRFAMKPCAMGVPKQIEKFVKIPEDYKVNVIRKYRAYLNGRILLEGGEGVWGWIIDKERLISYFLEGAEIVRKRLEDRPEILKQKLPGENVVISSGVYWSNSSNERINAVETLLKVDEGVVQDDIIEIHFDTDMLGYYWIFPWGDGVANVGLGGLESFPVLKRKLATFIKERKLLDKIFFQDFEKRIRGAQIIASGLEAEKAQFFDSIYVAGEALGAVFPLTGEGVRPSMLTSKILFDSLQANESYKENLISSELYYANRLQAKVFKIMKAVPSKMREMIMRSVPKDWLVKFGLGDFKKEEIKGLIKVGGLFIDLISPHL